MVSLRKVWTTVEKLSESDRRLTFHFPNINRTHQKLISTIVFDILFSRSINFHVMSEFPGSVSCFGNRDCSISIFFVFHFRPHITFNSCVIFHIFQCQMRIFLVSTRCDYCQTTLSSPIGLGVRGGRGGDTSHLTTRGS